MKKILSLALLFTLLKLPAQNVKFDRFNQGDPGFEILNKAKLDSIVTHSDAAVHYLLIYTNNCGGTHYLLPQLQNYVERYGKSLNIILASSEAYSAIAEVKNMVKKYNVPLARTYIIDSDIYKDNRRDARKKGFKFRNDLCAECKSDIIGVPYNILYDKKQNVIFHGYRNLLNFDSLLNHYINL